MAIRADEISRVLREEIENYERAVNVAETGSVISVGDGICTHFYGLKTSWPENSLSLAAAFPASR